MEYFVVFDVAQSGYRQWGFPAFGLIFVAVGCGLVLFRHRLPRRTSRFSPFALLGFAILWTLTTFLITVRDYLRLASALREGRCEIVEGEVTKFHPMPAEGHHEESFDVGGKHFQYADYIVIAGFNQSSSHGGPVREGIKVRIYHVGNIIARLEIAR